MSRLESCIEDIRIWMSNNFLKLNDSKTQFIMFGSAQNIEQVEEWTVTVGNQTILPSTTVRNIGAMLDTRCTMKSHITSIKKSCYLQLRSLSKIRNFETDEVATTLIHAFVTSMLDNMNALLLYIPDYQLKQLQLIQNNAARVITKQKKSAHITPTLNNLHWLPVQYRVEFKILLLVFKCLQ